MNVELSKSGVFLNIASSGYLLKVATLSEDLLGLKKGQFVEVETQFLATYVSHGQCQFKE